MDEYMQKVQHYELAPRRHSDVIEFAFDEQED